MKHLKSLSYMIAQLAVDLLIITGSLFLGYIIRLAADEKSSSLASYAPAFFIAIPILLVSYVFFFFLTRAFKIYWPFASVRDLVAVSICPVGAYLVAFLFGLILSNRLPFSVYLMGLMASAILIALFRVMLRVSGKKGAKTGPSQDTSGNVMIVGAGETGNYLLHEFRNNPAYAETSVVCLVDDDPMKQGKRVYGVPVVGTVSDIPAAVEKYSVSLIVFAITQCSASRRAEILSECTKTGREVRSVPAMSKLIDGKVSANTLRNVNIEDLLGRDPIRINRQQLGDSVKDKVVMVTGGGGSIGSELCRQIATFAPKKLVIVDIYENNAYDIQNELRRNHPDLSLDVRIASVRDVDKMERLFEELRPQVIFHAAAHKHVPLMEDSPDEAVKNNVFGTLNVVRMADRFRAERFVMISTDKAVNPTNVMGATKRVCEMIVQSYDEYSETEFVTVRFGNVLGSNGSVIPLFKKQIENGGPVTVTHPDIIRYFMTIPEAVSLVLQAASTAKGGEIFVLDMGKPVKILDLAENLIRLSGFTPGKDIEIKFTGLRPGEKLYEELLMDEEGLQATENELIHIGKQIEINYQEFYGKLSELRHAANEGGDVVKLLHETVPTFKTPEEVNAAGIKSE